MCGDCFYKGRRDEELDLLSIRREFESLVMLEWRTVLLIANGKRPRDPRRLLPHRIPVLPNPGLVLLSESLLRHGSLPRRAAFLAPVDAVHIVAPMDGITGSQVIVRLN